MTGLVEGGGRRWYGFLVPPGAEARPFLVVAAAAVAQVVTIVWTWDLWRAREFPPNLPVIDALAGVDFGTALVLVAMVCLLFPRWAGPAFCGVLGLAILGDQTRLQPEVLSLAILMTAPSFGVTGRSIARWHLSAVWLWSGLHKVLSLGWSSGSAAAIAGFLGVPDLRVVVAFALPIAELGVSAASLWPRAWPLVRYGGSALHVGIFLTLSPLFGDWNESVWSWNLALAVAAFVLFSDPSEGIAPTRLALGVGAALVAHPALFYAGRADAYVTHNLYTSNTATAVVCPQPDEGCFPAPFSTWEPLNVPLPPEPRLYRMRFELACTPDSVLVVTGPATRLTDPPTVRTSDCPRPNSDT